MKNVAIIVTAVIAYYAADWRRRSKSKAEFQRSVNSLSPSLEVDFQITSKLAECRVRLDADKAKIFRFHNGGIYFSGDSMKKFSLAFLQLRNGIAGPSPGGLKELNASLFPNMLRELISKKCVVVWEATNAPDDYLRVLHVAEGTSIVKCTALKNYKGEMLGFISLNWVDQVVPINPKDDEILLNFAQEIANLLSQNK